MIRPGLLTASTSKADHLGMSAAGLLCLSIVPVSFSRCVVLVLGSKTCVFPLRGEVGTRVGARGYGKFATSRLDESRLCAVRKVSDVLRFLVVLGVCFHWC